MNEVSAVDEALETALKAPQVRLYGTVDETWLAKFIDGVNAADPGGPLVIEVMTLGGDADIGRRLAQEVRLMRSCGRRVVFLGKTAVYSAGVTAMSGFPREDRYLTADATLLIHERQLTKTVELQGSLECCRLQCEAELAEIAIGFRLQCEGFEALIEGSSVGMDELLRKAATTWYVPAAEAVERGLVAAIWPGV